MLIIEKFVDYSLVPRPVQTPPSSRSCKDGHKPESLGLRKY